MGEADVATGIGILQRREIPHYILPESMCRAFAASLFFQEQKGAPPDPARAVPGTDPARARAILAQAKEDGRRYLQEEEAIGILAAFGFPVLPFGIATSGADAAAIGERIGYPVVLKVSSEAIVHKFDVGGVVVGVRDGREAAAAYERIVAASSAAFPGAEIRGVYVQKMVAGGEEVILGLKEDPSFGPVIMFGLGGIFVEIFKDVRFRVAPVGPASATAMVREIHAFRMLAGARGKARRDVAAIEECIQRLSFMAVECPGIAELDINPLIVRDEGQGAFVADARVLLQP
jgi:acetyltransferase